jgi:hypothetical protein
MAQDVDLDTKSSYSISITVSDGVNTSTAMDFSLSVSQLVITSSATVNYKYLSGVVFACFAGSNLNFIGVIISSGFKVCGFKVTN